MHMDDVPMDPKEAFALVAKERRERAEAAARAKQMRRILIVLAKREGRLRLSKRELEGLANGEGFSVAEDGEHVVVTYKAGR